MNERRFGQLLFEFERWGFDVRAWRPRTRQNYLRCVKTAQRWMLDHRSKTLARATRRDVEKYFFQTHPTPANRGLHRHALLGYYSFLVDRGYRRDNPAESLPKGRMKRGIPKPVTFEEAGQILSLAAEEPTTYALVCAMLFNGLRVTEARSLQWDQITDDWLMFTAKGGQERLVPMHPETLAALAKVPQIDPRWIFQSPVRPDTPISMSTAWKRISELGEQIGIHLHPHRLRHTFATRMLERGANIREVQEGLGHASLAHTQVYTKVVATGFRESIERLDFADAVS